MAYLAVLLSGAGGLIYQLAWTRWLASITSATHTAQALVLAVFMTGLALGAWLGGRLSWRAPRPLLAYAGVEVVAAVLAGLSVPVIPVSHALRDLAVSSGLSPVTGLWVQLAGLGACLLLPTTLLGASLPLVIEHFDRSHGRGGKGRTSRATALLYGWNTAGAAAGCLAAGYVTIESFGLARTIWIGMGCALLAAAVAALLPAPAAREAEPAAAESPSAGAGAWDGGGSGKAWTAAACLAGFTGLGAEVLWTRMVSLVVPTTVYALAQVLAAVLIGIALGGGLAAWTLRGSGTLASLRRRAALLLALAALAVAGVPLALLGIAGDLSLELELATGLTPEFGLLIVILAPPAGLLGAALPILAGARSRSGRSAGTFGSLYAANTFGGVAGSLAVGFALLPLLGSRTSTALLVLGAAALSAWFLAGTGASLRSWLLPGCLCAAACLLVAAVDTPRDLYRARLGPGEKILEFREGSTSDVMVTEDSAGARRLWINSSWVAADRGGHRILGHLPALLAASPERILGIALGTGQTFAAILQHGVRELYCVELDPGVIELSRRWFAGANQGLLDKPEVVLHRDDGRAFMRTTDKRFDLVVVEPLQPWSAGTTNLYTVGFYEEAEAVLKPGGIVAQWVPFYGQSPGDVRSMVRSAMEAFPHSSLWLDNRDGILLLSREPQVIDPLELEERIERRGIRPHLALNGLGEVPDLLSLFLMGAKGLEGWSGQAPPLTDGHPFLEFSAARRMGVRTFRAIVASALGDLEDPGDYMRLGEEGSFAMAARARAIRRALLREIALPPEDVRGRAAILEEGLAAVGGSSLLRKRHGELMRVMEGTGATDPVPTGP